MMLGVTFLLGAFATTWSAPAYTPALLVVSTTSPLAIATIPKLSEPLLAVPEIRLYSQFKDIHETKWQKVGCGVTSLAMIIDFYHPGTVSVDTLLHEGLASGAYLKDAGWKHRELALLARRYDLEGNTYDLSHLGGATAFSQFETLLKEGPVIASVHYKFDPKSTIPHLVVMSGMSGDRIFYNDPASSIAGQEISVADFKKGWKKRFIVVRPEIDTTRFSFETGSSTPQRG